MKAYQYLHFYFNHFNSCLIFHCILSILFYSTVLAISNSIFYYELMRLYLCSPWTFFFFACGDTEPSRLSTSSFCSAWLSPERKIMITLTVCSWMVPTPRDLAPCSEGHPPPPPAKKKVNLCATYLHSWLLFNTLSLTNPNPGGKNTHDNKSVGKVYSETLSR